MKSFKVSMKILCRCYRNLCKLTQKFHMKSYRISWSNGFLRDKVSCGFLQSLRANIWIGLQVRSRQLSFTFYPIHFSLESSFLWAINQCINILLKVSRLFGGIYCHHFQDWRVIQARIWCRQEIFSKPCLQLDSFWFLACLVLIS
jgi:hypothetical protein